MQDFTANVIIIISVETALIHPDQEPPAVLDDVTDLRAECCM